MYNFWVSAKSEGAGDAALEIGGRCLGLRTRMVDRAVSGVFDRAVRPHGIRITQVSALTAVAQAGEAGPAQLARWLHLEKSTVSRMVDRMISAGWLEPLEAEDGRSYRVRLTDAGQAKLVEVLPSWRNAQDEIEALMGEELATRLGQLASRLGQG